MASSPCCSQEEGSGYNRPALRGSGRASTLKPLEGNWQPWSYGELNINFIKYILVNLCITFEDLRSRHLGILKSNKWFSLWRQADYVYMTGTTGLYHLWIFVRKRKLKSTRKLVNVPNPLKSLMCHLNLFIQVVLAWDTVFILHYILYH